MSGKRRPFCLGLNVLTSFIICISHILRHPLSPTQANTCAGWFASQTNSIFCLALSTEPPSAFFSGLLPFITFSLNCAGLLCRIQIHALNHLPKTKWPPFADDILKLIFMNGKFCIFIRISLLFVRKGKIGTKSVLIQVIVWRQTGSRLLPEPMLTRLTDAYIRHWERWFNCGDSRSLLTTVQIGIISIYLPTFHLNVLSTCNLL